MSKTWDGKFSNLKISEQAFPELHRELADLHHKERSDRLRSLAMLGLYSLHNMGQNRAGPPATANLSPPNGADHDVSPGPSAHVAKTQEDLKDRLLGSVRS
jgi:hypothetical protein